MKEMVKVAIGNINCRDMDDSLIYEYIHNHWERNPELEEDHIVTYDITEEDVNGLFMYICRFLDSDEVRKRLPILGKNRIGVYFYDDKKHYEIERIGRDIITTRTMIHEKHE